MSEPVVTTPSTQPAAPAAPAPSSAPASAPKPAPMAKPQAPAAPAANRAQGGPKPPAPSTTPDRGSNQAPQPGAKPATVHGGQPAGDAAGQPAQPAIDYKTQYEQLHRSNSELGRRIAERDKAFNEMQQQLQGFTKQQDAQRKQAEAAKLKPYMAKHPDYQSTLARAAKADAFDAALAAAPPELQQNPQYRSQLAARMGVRNEDLSLRDEAKAHKEAESQRMAADPDAYINERAEQIAEQKFNELFGRKQEEQRIEQEIHQDFNDPVVRQFTEEHNEEVQQAIRDGVPPKYAAHQIKMFTALQTAEAKIAELESRLEDQSQDVGMAKEQQRLLKSRATQTREPAGKAVVDPHKSWTAWCEEQKIPVGDRLNQRAQRKLSEFIKASLQTA